MSTGPESSPISPADWARWTLPARGILLAARRLANVPPGDDPPAPARRRWVARIAKLAKAEAGALADALIAGHLTLDRWLASMADLIGTYYLAATLAWLGGAGPDDLQDADREALATLIGRQVVLLGRLRDRIASGDQPLDRTFARVVADLAALAGDVAAYVGLGREATPRAGDLDAAATLWRKLAPEWARGLIDAGTYEG